LLRRSQGIQVDFPVTSLLVIAARDYIEGSEEDDYPKQGIPHFSVLDLMKGLIDHIISGLDIQEHTHPHLSILIIDQEFLFYERENGGHFKGFEFRIGFKVPSSSSYWQIIELIILVHV